MSEHEESKRGRGRPKKDAVPKEMVSLRLDVKDIDLLRHLEIESDENKSEILRKALRTYYHLQSRKW